MNEKTKRTKNSHTGSGVNVGTWHLYLSNHETLGFLGENLSC